MFQHLSEPMFAMNNLRRCLARGGRLCICDVDDRWLSVEPEPPELQPFLSRVHRAQNERGGDRYVASKLANYFKRAGFVDIRSSMLLVTTDLVGGTAFTDLVFGYKLEVVPENELEQARRELSAITASVHGEHGTGAVGAFLVSAQLP